MVQCHQGPLVLMMVLVAGACVKVTYPGPRRPSTEVATIEGRNVAIDGIDGITINRGERLEVLPGDHLLRVHLAIVTRIPIYNQPIRITVLRTSLERELCVNVSPQHTYVIVPWVDGNRWAPLIADGASDRFVPPCSGGPAPDR